MTLNLLLSYYYLRRGPIRRPPWVRRLFIDSGAFSAQSNGKHASLREYIKWIQDNRQSLDLYAALDVIGDPVKTRRNLEIMRAEGLDPVPVFHAMGPLEEFDRLVEERPPLIAIGGMVSYLGGGAKTAIFQRIAEIFDRANGTPLHGFGVATSAGTDFPWRSCDASLIGKSFGFGLVCEYDRKGRKLLSCVPRRDSPRKEGRPPPLAKWRSQRIQMRVAQAHGFSRSQLVEKTEASRGRRVVTLISATLAFEAHMRETREFDFFHACESGHIWRVERAVLEHDALTKGGAP
jgi:hypothetical protein